MLKLGNKLGNKLGKKNSSNCKKIMVRCCRSNYVLYREEGEGPICWRIPPAYDCYDFYLVDLKGDRNESVLQPYCEPLLDDGRGPGSFICLGSFIYSTPLIRYCEYENIPDALPYPNTGEMVNRLKGIFVTTLDKAQNPKKWTSSCLVPEDFYCAALHGAIYGLKSGNIDIALCFKPSENCWVPSNAPPPPNLNRCSVNGTMISDPINDRILVHLCGGGLTLPSLYAWHPKIVGENGQAWKLLEPFNISLWSGGTTLINIDNKSLLFFFFHDSKDLFKVWSLEDHKFLEIRWCNEVPKLELLDDQPNTMCHLGKNQLCLALSFPKTGKIDCRITFLIFKINHLTSKDIKGKGKGKDKAPADDVSSDTIITFTYVSSKSFQASDAQYAVDITPLGEVY